MVDWDINLTLNLMSVDIDHEVIEEEEGIAFGESEATVLSHVELTEASIHHSHTSPSLAANNRGLGSTRFVPTTDFVHANSHNAK